MGTFGCTGGVCTGETCTGGIRIGDVCVGAFTACPKTARLKARRRIRGNNEIFIVCSASQNWIAF
jgi:hypothetical protein